MRITYAGVLLVGLLGCAGADPQEMPEEYGLTTDELARSANMGCADPGLDYDNGTYYLVCTNRNTRYYTSTDLVNWVGHNMSITFPSWVQSTTDVWGMEFEKIDGTWYLYFSAPDKNNPAAAGGYHKAIGVLKASAMTDNMTWTPANASAASAPLVAKNLSSIIDPFVYNDNGQLYIFYNQYNPGKIDSGIYVNKLSDPATKVCCQTPLIGAYKASTPSNKMRSWTGTTVEAPAVIKNGSYYYLYFSGNIYANASYGTGLARSTSITGPYTEAPDSPQINCSRMVSTFGGTCSNGPGGASVSPNGAFVFHAAMSTETTRWVYSAPLGIKSATGWLYPP